MLYEIYREREKENEIERDECLKVLKGVGD